jgi:hypothetical protein
VDSRAIITMLNTAGTQSNTLCNTGCSLKWSMRSIIDVGGARSVGAETT